MLYEAMALSDRGGGAVSEQQDSGGRACELPTAFCRRVGAVATSKHVDAPPRPWQMDSGSRYIFVDGDNCHLHAYELIPEKNIYKICFSAGDSRLQCGVVNAATGRVIVPPQYDTLDVL